MEYTTYLFDFDYTLADSSRGIVICFRNVLERHGHTGITDEQIKHTIGKTLEESFTILTGIDDVETLASYRKEYIKEADEHMNVNTVLFPETESVLHQLKRQGAKIGIISTKFRYRIQEVVDKHFPKDFFDIIVGGEDVKAMKPDPQGILKALKKLRRNRKETLYIGDSTVDAQTALNAKVDFIGVLNGMTTREELKAYPHRQILENLYLLPLVQRPSEYKPFKFGKVESIYRAIQIKLIRGRKTESPTLLEVSTCKNCGEVYVGNYCSKCGQTRYTHRFTARNAFQNILSGFFNIDNGFSRNLLEFLYRPGYMIRNYLDGKRVNYFKPFQTLFVLAALYVIAVQLIDPASMRLLKKEETEYTYETLKENIRELKEEAYSNHTLNLLERSEAYADSARSMEESIEPKTSHAYDFSQKTAIELLTILAPKINDYEDDPEKVKSIIREVADSLTREDSLKLIDAGYTERIIIQEKAKERKRIIHSFLSQKETDVEDIFDKFINKSIESGNWLRDFKDKYLGEDSFIVSVFNLMEGWMHGNKAFSILALLPVLTFGVQWGFRRTPVGRRLNTTELFFSQVYIAGQILWLSILILPFTGKAHLDDVFDLDYVLIFLLYVWDFRQLFGVSWGYSFKRTIVGGCYCLLLLLGISILLVLMALLLAWVISGENPFL